MPEVLVLFWYILGVQSFFHTKHLLIYKFNMAAPTRQYSPADILSLTWKEFNSTFSGSLETLRRENAFYDVTLVTEDDMVMNAHKVVLSSSSLFFKSVLMKLNSLQNPCLYLGGVSGPDLQVIMDFIYKGEARLYQQHMDSFLNAAAKLKISGLMSNTKPSTNKLEPRLPPLVMPPDFQAIQNSLYEEFNVPQFPEPNISKALAVNEPGLVDPTQDQSPVVASIADLENKVKELIDGTTCKVCGKNIKNRYQLVGHVETHIEGLSYSCTLCDKQYSSRDSLRVHNYRCSVQKNKTLPMGS